MAKKVSTSTSSTSRSDLSDLIRKKAYEIWEKKGRKNGSQLENWLEAERIIKKKAI